MGHKDVILAVDDDPQHLRMLQAVLDGEGYEILLADNGEHALASVATRAPDLILVDYFMPEMSGLEVCRRIKSDPQSRNIPLIMVSDSADSGEHLEGFRTGAVDFIAKPFQREEVLARVNAHLELSRLRREIERQVEERTLQLTLANEHLQRELMERKRSEAALREGESRFRNMADTAPVMIVSSGADKLATFFNRGWLEFRGRTMEQELGMGWAEGLHPDDRDTLLASYAASFDDRRKCHLEYRLRRADGEYRWVLCTGVPLFQTGGVFIGYIGSCVDITDFKRSQEEKLAAQKAESLEVLAAGIAQDFNNLLGALFAEADLAISELGPQTGAREHIQNINAIAMRASEIVDLLTTYAASRPSPVLEVVDLSALVEEILRLMRASLSRKGLEITCNLTGNLPPVRVNNLQVRRVVMNLLTNAAEALESREGSLTISTSIEHIRQNLRPVKPVDLPEGDYVNLAIADTGSGMTEEELARAMDPFFSTKFLGRGMGLAVAQRIVRSHGGAIRAASNIGFGSTFEVLLPCAAEGAAGKAVVKDVPAREAPSARSGTVLLVEDEQTLRVALEKALDKRGFVVISATHGEEALAKLLTSTQEIDVVLLDITLPGMSGGEVLAEMRKIRADLKVVLTSAHDLDIRNFDIAAGDPKPKFIRKPCRLKELVDTLREEIASGR